MKAYTPTVASSNTSAAVRGSAATGITPAAISPGGGFKTGSGLHMSAPKTGMGMGMNKPSSTSFSNKSGFHVQHNARGL